MNPKLKTTIIVISIILILAIIGFIVYFLIQKNASADFIPEQGCSYDVYNCDDFQSQAKAQEAFETCGGIENDLHNLDKDGNGIACEGLG